MSFALFQNKTQTITNYYSTHDVSSLASSIIGLEGVFLAVATPLLFNTLIKSSEKYCDSELPRVINNSRSSLFYLASVIIHIIWGLFIIRNGNGAIEFSLPSLISNNAFCSVYFLSFLILGLFYLQFGRQIISMSLKPESIIFNEIDDLTKNKEKIKFSDLKTITFLIEKIENILKYKIRTDEFQSFKTILDRLLAKYNDVTLITCERIDQLKPPLFSNDDLEIALIIESTQDDPPSIRNKRHSYDQIYDHNALLERNFNVIQNLWNTALRNNNEQVLIALGRRISSFGKETPEDFTLEYSKSTASLLENLLYISKPYENLIKYSFATSNNWFYFLFLSLTSSPSKYNFDVLNLCRKSYTRQIIEQLRNPNKIFHSYVCKTILEGHFDLTHKTNTFYDLERKFLDDRDLYRQVKSEIKRIKQASKEIKNEDTFLFAINKLKEFSETYESDKKHEGFTAEITKYIEWEYKFSLLQIFHFTTGAFCVFKSNFETIKYMWTFKQPHDSSASWSGPNIIPVSIQDTIDIYFSRIGYSNSSFTFEDHHSSDLYFKKYFILLIIKNHEDNDIQIKTDNPISINSIINECKRLKKVAQSFSPEDSCFDLFPKIDFKASMKNVDCILDQTLEAASLKLKSIEDSKEVDQAKIKNFQQSVHTSFIDNFIIAHIFKQAKRLKKLTSPDDAPKEAFGFSLLERKAAFFEDWHVSYSGLGEHLGSELASSATRKIVNQMMKSASNTYKSINDALLQTNNREIILIMKNSTLYTMFEDSKNLKYFTGTAETPAKPTAEYTHRRRTIPIYTFKSDFDGVLALYTDELPYLKIFNPQEDQTEIDSIINNEMLIKVQDIDGNKVNEIAEHNKKQYPSTKSIDDIIDDIKLRVSIKVFIKFTIDGDYNSLYITNSTTEAM